MKDKQINELYEFSSFLLDVKKRRLTCGDEIIPLTPKEFEVLFLLIENAGRVVEKNELLETIWKDTYVEEGTLTRNISWLRKKLAAHDTNDLQIIETVPKRGYRFLPEITKSQVSTFVVTEQIIQQINIEESIEILPSSDENEISFVDGRLLETPKRKALPAATFNKQISTLWLIPILLIFAVVAVSAYYGYLSQNRSNVILASKIAPFSGLPGRETSPSFSPDGKQLVYAWNGGIENGNLDIYIKLVGAGETMRLTNTETDEINPTFSPDGKSIAFVRHFPTHNEIITVPALGGAERRLDENAGFASLSFSPDGKSLAAADLDTSEKKAGIYLINLANGEKTQFTTPENPAVDLSPRFSPDGKSLAFIRYFSSFRREIFVVSTAGGKPRQITFDDTRIYGLDWNNDSQKLFFTSFRTGNQLSLWQISLNGKNEPQVIPTGSKNLDSLAVAPDGKTIAFVENTTDENIWEFEGNMPPRPLIRSTLADHSPQFSPDGTKIVFASDRTGSYEIWLTDADGKNQHQLTNSSASSGSPRFSPDGNFIVFDAQMAGGSDIYIISVNGGTPQRLTENARQNSLPAWSADGKWIFFISDRSGDNQIWKMSVDGGSASQITKQGAFEMFATSDGTKIVYSKSVGKSGLWSVGTDGNDEKAIPELAAAANWRSWSVAANGVYYTNFATQSPFQIKFFDFDTKLTKNVAAMEKPPLLYYSNLAVSPDGKKILYAREDQSASAIMLADLDK